MKKHKHTARRRRELGNNPNPVLEDLFRKIESQKTARPAKKTHVHRRK